MSNNKTIYGFLVWCACLLQANAQQISFNSWSNNYLYINSYNGNTDQNAYTLVLAGNGIINVPNWKISVKLKQPIISGTYTFPTNKISLQPTTTLGEAVPGPVPAISQIGMPLNVVLQAGQEVFLVPQSNAPLYNNNQYTYYQLQLKYSLTIEGGTYLSQFPTDTRFYPQLEFRVYDQFNNLIGNIREHTYDLQIGTLSGIPPDPTPQFSITVDGNAINGLLELKTKADYEQGASVIYPNGLKISANTAYQVNVKSLQGTFMSAQGNTLPLSTVQVSLIPASGNPGTVFPVWLTASNQKVASGNTTQGVQAHYDIKYASKPNDINFITSEKDSYSTTLQYEIMPQ